MAEPAGHSLRAGTAVGFLHHCSPVQVLKAGWIPGFEDIQERQPTHCVGYVDGNDDQGKDEHESIMVTTRSETISGLDDFHVSPLQASSTEMGPHAAAKRKEKVLPLVDLDDVGVSNPQIGVYLESSNASACPTPEMPPRRLASPAPRPHFHDTPPLTATSAPTSFNSPATPPLPLVDPFSPFASPERTIKGKEKELVDVSSSYAYSQPLVQHASSPGVIYPHNRPSTPSPTQNNPRFLSTSPVAPRRTKSLGGFTVKKVGSGGQRPVGLEGGGGKFVPGSFGAPMLLSLGEKSKARSELLIDFGFEEEEVAGVKESYNLVDLGEDAATATTLAPTPTAFGFGNGYQEEEEEVRLVDVSPHRPTVRLENDLWITSPEPLWNDLELQVEEGREQEEELLVLDAENEPMMDAMEEGRLVDVEPVAVPEEKEIVPQSIPAAEDGDVDLFDNPFSDPEDSPSSEDSFELTTQEDEAFVQETVVTPQPISDPLTGDDVEEDPAPGPSPASTMSVLCDEGSEVEFSDPEDLPLPSDAILLPLDSESDFPDPDLPELPPVQEHPIQEPTPALVNPDLLLAIASVAHQETVKMETPVVAERRPSFAQIPTPPDSPPTWRRSMSLERSSFEEERLPTKEVEAEPNTESSSAVSEEDLIPEQEREDDHSPETDLSDSDEDPSEEDNVSHPVVDSSSATSADEHVSEAEDSDSAAPPAWSVRAAEAPRLGVVASTPSKPVPEPTATVKPKASEEATPSPQETDSEDAFDSLPGSFPESKEEPAAESSSSETSSQTISPARPRATSVSFASTISTLTRRRRPSPLDVALAMQMRPGLGAGADPAFMVRFLMAAFGWLVVVVSGNIDDL
ncbi:hypothetical protein CC1G_12112 [Coprinopsis cinerea okayama7|uniref:Uncharacterized protein n=1 Tax=Coprinopsis cinerea (strain Okayama-7 / 130 / ATCC MYA-4618 / FGSC 9003) TaxID=240176 RepID=A8PHB3_COPC7|nr:hypothetical protein CC1G_12112 [Coprinopsis cinerea okayama7\|eukprot:XP_001841377.2 hypothetical protein CC1G_12112 [Coprinopsis cinerea okayama7\